MNKTKRLLLATVVLVAQLPALAQTPFVPDDPYYFPNPTNTSYSQWYLNRTGTTAVVDINVAGAWFVNDEVEYSHPDLAANYDAGDSWNFYDNNSDPSPDYSIDSSHGTAVIGLACARGGNGIGMTGIAPFSRFAALKVTTVGVIYGDDTAGWQRFADAERYHSSGTNASIIIKSISFGETGGLGALIWPGLRLIDPSVVASTQAGTIHVASAGNQRLQHGVVNMYDGDSNRKYMNHLPETITVAGINSQGRCAEYSSWGACVAGCTPTGETIWNGGVNLMSTDLTGANGYNPNRSDTFPDRNYTSVFTGTSSTSPIMSGILALAKQAQPNLNTRMAKHLLARTSALIDQADATPMGGWITNTAGFHFNNNYGFGLVDADALTLAAVQYSGVTPLVTRTTGFLSAGMTKIPIGNAAGVTQAVTVATSGPLEEVCIRLIVNPEVYPNPAYYNGDKYGQLELAAISPTGTRSLMAYRNSGSRETATTLDWVYTSHAFWGEEAAGEWKIIVSHPNPGSNFDWDYYWQGVEIITRSGQLIPAAPSLVTLTNFGTVSNHFAFTLTGPVNQSVAIESSPDLTTWTALQTNTLSGGTSAFTDADPVGTSNRFYRTRVVSAATALAIGKAVSPASWRVIWPATNSAPAATPSVRSLRAMELPPNWGAGPL
ncbi:MAG: S8 family serine peptidase [Verrucomicrobia bacterium]|nr:S8 family serine peptidase [Verrucomicrobiota bacterium]